MSPQSGASPHPTRKRGRIGGFLASHKLKLALIGGDSLAVLLGFLIALSVSESRRINGTVDTVVLLALIVATGIWAIRSQGLLLARVSAVRVMEITRATRAMLILGAAVLLFDRVGTLSIRVRHAALGAALSLVFMVAIRAVYRSWVAAARQRGAYGRRVVMIGTDHETRRLKELFITHRDLGIHVVGVVGDRDQAERNGLLGDWLGSADLAEAIVEQAQVSGVVISANGVPSSRLNGLIRNLQLRGIHVHLAMGLSGIDFRRFKSLSLAHEPMLYVEAPTLARSQVIVKRAFDLVIASVALVVSLPILLIVALAIKLDDRGPVFFRQQRVGRGGSLFGVWKFRTMVVDAEKQLARLAATNERNGPLFKMTRDPRVTRVGRFLRESSLDELPQLFNVLTGSMSLVGPRPALPKEVASFSKDLRAREQVTPGISGLWQVEARDNPSFEAYRRLDLFYVENWSITLDLLIILVTIEQLAIKFVSLVIPRRKALDEQAEVARPDPWDITPPASGAA